MGYGDDRGHSVWVEEVGWWVAVAGIYVVCGWALLVLLRDRGRKAAEIEELRGHISELIEAGQRERRADRRLREAQEEFHRLELEWYRLRAERDASRSSGGVGDVLSSLTGAASEDISIRVESRRLDEQIAEHVASSSSSSDSSSSASSEFNESGQGYWSEEWIHQLRAVQEPN